MAIQGRTGEKLPAPMKGRAAVGITRRSRELRFRSTGCLRHSRAAPLAPLCRRRTAARGWREVSSASGFSVGLIKTWYARQSQRGGGSAGASSNPRACVSCPSTQAAPTATGRTGTALIEGSLAMHPGQVKRAPPTDLPSQQGQESSEKLAACTVATAGSASQRVAARRATKEAARATTLTTRSSYPTPDSSVRTCATSA